MKFTEKYRSDTLTLSINSEYKIVKSVADGYSDAEQVQKQMEFLVNLIKEEKITKMYSNNRKLKVIDPVVLSKMIPKFNAFLQQYNVEKHAYLPPEDFFGQRSMKKISKESFLNVEQEMFEDEESALEWLTT